MENQREEPSSYWQQTVPVVPFSYDLPSHADLMILGAGWLSTTVAYWAAQTGASVLLLDRQGFVGRDPDEPYSDNFRHHLGKSHPSSSGSRKRSHCLPAWGPSNLRCSAESACSCVLLY